MKVTDDSENGAGVRREMSGALDKFNEALINVDGLALSSRGKAVALDGANRSIFDDQLAGSCELVVGC